MSNSGVLTLRLSKKEKSVKSVPSVRDSYYSICENPVL